MIILCLFLAIYTVTLMPVIMFESGIRKRRSTYIYRLLLPGAFALICAVAIARFLLQR